MEIRKQLQVEGIPPGALLNVLERQLYLLQEELRILRAGVSQASEVTQQPRSFADLAGAWAGVEISGEEIEAAQLDLPRNL